MNDEQLEQACSARQRLSEQARRLPDAGAEIALQIGLALPIVTEYRKHVIVDAMDPFDALVLTASGEAELSQRRARPRRRLKMAARSISANVIRLVPKRPPRKQLSADTIAALEKLLRRAKDGTVHGIAYSALLKYRGCIADTAGGKTGNQAFARGMVRALDDKLSFRALSLSDPRP